MSLPIRYADVNASGVLTGFYSSDVNSTIPAGAIELTEAQYQTWLAAQQSWSWQNGTLTAYTPPVPVLTLPQQAGAMLLAGCQVASTSTAALDGTYPTDPASQAHVTAEITSVLLNGTFADGTASIAWLDVAGAAHTFTVLQFKTLATALAGFVSGALKVINGQAMTLPAQPVTIA